MHKKYHITTDNNYMITVVYIITYFRTLTQLILLKRIIKVKQTKPRQGWIYVYNQIYYLHEKNSFV